MTFVATRRIPLALNAPKMYLWPGSAPDLNGMAYITLVI